MKAKLLCLGVFLFTNLYCYAQIPANDNCANAEIISVTSTNSTLVNFNNGMATQSLLSSCDTAATPYLDVWYEFTMPVNGNIQITGVNFTDGFSLYNTCGGAEIACFYDDGFFYNLSVGTYKLRAVSTQANAGADSFNIQAFETVVNDECATAEVIMDDITTQRSFNYDNRGATESLDASCDNAINTYLDIWYEFTMPVNGNLQITGVNIFDRFTLYDTCGGTEIVCSADDTFTYNLMTGTYILRVSKQSIYASADSFNLQAFASVANDECANAEVITDDITTERTINYDNRGATESLDASCDNAGNTHLDIWYEFTMPVNGNVRITGVNIFDEFTLYDTCGGSELACFNDDGFVYNLTIGTYILRVYKRDIYASADSFNIQAFEATPNNECATAEVITDDITTQRTIFFDNRAATESLNASCDNASNTYLDVWYEFTMPVNGNLRITGVNFLDRFTLYDACGGSELFCDAGSFFVYNLTTGTYYLRAYSQSIHASSESFSIQAFEQLTNDDCANVEMISVAGIGACGTQNITVDLRGSSETVAPNIGDCFSTSQTWLDAWYSFEAPITGNITLTSTNSNNTFAVYEACGGFEVACFTDDGVIPVTFGNTYYIQAARASNFAGELTFCLEGSPAVATGSAGVCETMPAIEISTAQGNTNEWVPIFDASSNIVAAINANGNDLGNLNTTLFIENADTRDFSGQPYSRREVSISTSNAPSTNVTVRLYMLGGEVEDLILADSNLTNITGIELMKVSGNTCTAGYVSGGNFINTSSSSYLDTDYYLQFSTNSFSVFYPTSTNLSETLSIPSIENNVLGITISPTLTDGIIYIKSDTSLADVTLDVFDMTKRNIYQACFEHINQTQQSVNLSGYTSGVYFMKITHQDKQLTKRIILK